RSRSSTGAEYENSDTDNDRRASRDCSGRANGWMPLTESWLRLLGRANRNGNGIRLRVRTIVIVAAVFVIFVLQIVYLPLKRVVVHADPAFERKEKVNFIENAGAFFRVVLQPKAIEPIYGHIPD